MILESVGRPQLSGLVSGVGRGIRGWCSRVRGGKGRGEDSGRDVVVVVDLGGGLAGVGPQIRPAYWTRRPLKVMGAARKRVSSAGQSKPSPI